MHGAKLYGREKDELNVLFQYVAEIGRTPAHYRRKNLTTCANAPTNRMKYRLIPHVVCRDTIMRTLCGVYIEMCIHCE